MHCRSRRRGKAVESLKHWEADQTRAKASLGRPHPAVGAIHARQAVEYFLALDRIAAAVDPVLDRTTVERMNDALSDQRFMAGQKVLVNFLRALRR